MESRESLKVEEESRKIVSFEDGEREVMSQGMWMASSSWGQLSANSQGNGDIHPKTMRINSINNLVSKEMILPESVQKGIQPQQHLEL